MPQQCVRVVLRAHNGATPHTSSPTHSNVAVAPPPPPSGPGPEDEHSGSLLKVRQRADEPS